MAKAKEKVKLLTAFVPYVLLQISNLWNGQVNPKLTTMSKMEQALSEDSDPPANLIIIIHGS